MNRQYQKAAAPGLAAFFVVFFLWLPGFAFADCQMPQNARQVLVKKVNDGDTIKLASGEKVRLLGINTPEMNYRGGEADPEFLAVEARDALQGFIKRTKVLYISTGREKKDSYQRTLAHLWNDKGESAAMYLLRQGLGVQVVFPPNLAFIDCHRRAENLARQNKLGLWSRPVEKLERKTWLGTGFHLLDVKVTRIEESRSGWWIELDGPLVLKAVKGKGSGFTHEQLQSLVGKRLKVRGWVVARDKTVIQKGRKPYMMLLRHHSMITVIAGQNTPVAK